MTPPVRGCAYFLDIDGTLVDLAPTPARITLPRSLPALVDALSRSSGGAVALISGRGLADIDRLFPGTTGRPRDNTVSSAGPHLDA